MDRDSERYSGAHTFRELIETRLNELSNNQRTGFYQWSEGKALPISYARFAEDVSRTRERLEASGVVPKMRIGILAQNSYEWILHDFACITLGCTSVALPVEMLSENRDSLCDRFDLNALMVSSDELPESAPSHIASLEGSEVFQVIGEATEDFTYSLAFGSGTEGPPKCMKMDFDAFLWSFPRYRNLLELNSSDNLVLFLPLTVFQQRAMVYLGVLHGFVISIVAVAEVMAALPTLRPTLVIAPPLFYEAIEFEYNRRYRKLPGIIRGLMSLLGDTRFARWITYRPLHRLLGGKFRIMLVGAATSNRKTLEFFQRASLPLYEAYGLTEIGMIAANRPGANRLGSVGQPVFDGSIRIAPDDEIIVKHNQHWSTGYINVPDEMNRRTYRPDNEIATGDLGRIDDDGYLFIIGRKKNTLVLTSGQKIQAEEIEREIEAVSGIRNAVALGTGLPFVALVLSFDKSILNEEVLGQALSSLNERLPVRARVAHVIRTEEKFTRENGLLNRNYKVNRKAVEAKFEANLAELTESGGKRFTA